MKDSTVKKQELIEEIATLKKKITKLEESEAGCEQTKEALRESLLRNKALLDANPDMFFVFSADGRFVDAKAERSDDFYTPSADFIGKRIEDVLPPDLAQETIDRIAEVKRSGRLVAYNYTLGMHGKQKSFESRLVPCDNGTVMAVVRDISDRKQTEDALKESEQNYRMLATYHKHLNEIFIDFTEASGTKDLLNRITDSFRVITSAIAATFSVYDQEARALKIVCLSIDPMLGDKVSSIFGPDLFKMHMPVSSDDMAQMLSQGIRRPKDLCEFSFGVVAQDISNTVMDTIGCRQIVAISVSYAEELFGTCATYLSGDQPVVPDEALKTYKYISGLAVKRMGAQEALKESEERFRSVVEKSSVGIAIVDDTFLCTYANKACCDISGYTEQELIGKNFTFLLADESKVLAVERYQSRQRGEDVPAQYEISFVQKNGEKRLGEVRSAVYLDSVGKVKSIIQVIDISERRKAAEDKRLLEERLQQADKMEAIGTLAGGIAHDFNNLLMGIQGYASMGLRNLDSSHPNYERLKSIEDQVRSGADLTAQLLGFARGGRYEVKTANMNEIITKSVSLFGRTKKEIAIHRKPAKDLWSVEVDRGQMEQVFLNLFVNAWQAMPRGGNIYLETQNALLNGEQALFYDVKPGKHVQITVTDTGTGMDAKTKERIFEPFFTTKGMGRGTGLGLATVYGIIKGHGGMINVYSEPEHGTTFTIYLPASEKQVLRQETPIDEILMGTETILLIDDEKIVMEVNKELLESMGYTLYVAGSGQEGLDIYKEKKETIDLIILDMIMPGISGSDTFDRLREINPKVKVLLSSGYSLTGKAQAIMDRGCNGFLQKPFKLEELSGKVREVLN